MLASDNASEHERSVAGLNHRKEQMTKLLKFRPFWMLSGPCSGNKRVISEAGNVSCPCYRADYSCRLHSLSRVELKRYQCEEQ